MFDWLSEIFATLQRNKLRTSLTALSVAWGVFMLVVLLAAGRGLQNGVEWDFRHVAVNSIWIRGGVTGIPYKGRRPGRDISFKNSDFEALPREIPGIEYLTGRFYLWGEFMVSRGAKHSSFEVRGTHPDHRYIEKTIIVEGRYIDDADIRERRKVAVIGSLVKQFLFGDVDPVGEAISIRGVRYTVVGVFHDEGGENELRQIFVPITTAQLLYNNPDVIHSLVFTIGDATEQQSEQMSADAHRILAARHDVAPDDNAGVRVSNSLESYERVTAVFKWIRVFVWLVGVGTLLAGIVGLSNIMLISVAERTKEIGIRKALGATPGAIVRTIMAEALFITAAAGYLGLVAGVGLVELVNRFSPELGFLRHPSVDVRVAVIATLLIVTAGSIAGFFPAWRAARVNPIAALRDE
ncbi:MAG TPA: ABC transporter permease [Polyangiaceae bacterium]|jgi:putative ABC transport system permease protein